MGVGEDLRAGVRVIKVNSVLGFDGEGFSNLRVKMRVCMVRVMVLE